MGGLCSSDPDPVPTQTTVVQGTKIPEWVSQGGQRLFGQAENLAQRPYEPYTGPRVADFSADENTAFDLTRSNAGAWSPDLGAGRDLITAGAAEWSPEMYDRYANPYAQAVTDIAKREAIRDDSIARIGRDAKAVAAGAFGGARNGVIEAEAQRNLGQRLDDIQMRGSAAAYDSALSAFDADRARSAQAGSSLAALGKLGSELGAEDANRLLQSGAVQRGQTQTNLDTAYGDYQEQRSWPYQQLNFALGALSGVPYDRQSTSSTSGTQYVQGTNPLSSLAGLGLAGAGIYSLLR